MIIKNIPRGQTWSSSQKTLSFGLGVSWIMQDFDLLFSPMVVCNISQTQTHTDKQMTHKGNMTCRPRLINSLSQTNYCLGIATSGIWLESIKGTTTAKSDATDCQGIMDANGTDAQLPRRTYRNRCAVREPNRWRSSQEPACIHRKRL